MNYKLQVGSGRVTWDTLQFCDVSQTPNPAKVGEDLYQVVFDTSDLVVDLGYYGPAPYCFIVFIVKDGEWDRPISKSYCLQWQEALEMTQAALDWCGYVSSQS